MSEAKHILYVLKPRRTTPTPDITNEGMKSLNILYILRHDPWGRGGGCYACRTYLEAFIEAFAAMCGDGHDGPAVDVIVCDEYLAGRDAEADFPCCVFHGTPPRSKVSRLLMPLTGIMHRHQAAALHLLRTKRYDHVVFDDNCIAGSLVGECRRRGIATAVINHNCEQEYWRDNTAGLQRMALLPVVRRNERRSYRECDLNIFLTDEDRQTFRRLYGEPLGRTVVGCCFLPRGTQMCAPAERQSAATVGRRFTAVISGTIGNVQNMDGITFFLDELYDALPPNVDVVITGQRPPEGFADRLKKYDRVTLVPNPDDILSVVREADIFLCPTRTGGGMKLRVIDGLRCGLPVIVHDISARGYSAFFDKDYFFHFTTKEDFAAAVSKLIRSYDAGNVNRAAIIADARRAFSFEEAVERLRQAIESK